MHVGIISNNGKNIRINFGRYVREFVIGENGLTNCPSSNCCEPLPCIGYCNLTNSLYSKNSTVKFTKISQKKIAPPGIMDSHRLAIIHFADKWRKLKLRWNFRFFEGTEGCESFIDIKTKSAPLEDWRITDREDRLETIPFDTRNSTFHSVSFFPCTDHHNDFVTREDYKLKGKEPLYIDGNILRTELKDGTGLVIIKIAPSPADRREKVKANFRVESGIISVMGWGLEPYEIATGEWIRSHSVITVPYKGGKTGAVVAVREFFRRRWLHSFNAPAAIVVNPWGGGGRYLYRHFSDDFINRELEASALLHATEYQIDDGWQAGGYLRELGEFGRIPDNDFWKIDKEKFPKGFSLINATGKKNGVRLGLWYAPNFNTEYAEWKDEADRIVWFHKKYGIKFVKIDGVQHRSRRAETNLDSLLRYVIEKTKGKVYFNLDVTAGIRLGFLYSPEFGPLFPANRYPFARRKNANRYRPQNTLRNFWNLCEYLPSHLVQVEVPNIGFNPEEFTEYGDPKLFRELASDPHGSSKYGGAYCAALSFFGSPLMWLQPSRTPKKLLQEYGKVMELHLRERNNIVSGDVFPIGGEPDGKSICGLASVNNAGGVAAIYREIGAASTKSLEIPLTGNGTPEIIMSNTKPTAEIRNGTLKIKMPNKRSFAIIKWKA